MPRPRRVDDTGFWHHITNGGVAQRTLFETLRDVRYLLSLFARMVRAGRIEVHAFAIMANHYHVVLRSLDGQISRTLQWIEARYAEYFNRTRGRTGSVFGGRFWSKVVETACYWGTVVRYVHGNPVRANIVEAAEDYKHGSARLLLADRAPRWLDLSLVREFLAPEIERIRRGESGNLGLDDGPVGKFGCRLVERRLGRERRAPDPLDDLVRSSPEHVQRWMRQRARQADGESAPHGVLLVSPTTILRVLRLPTERMTAKCFRTGSDTGLTSLAAGLLHCFGGSKHADVATMLEVSPSTARSWVLTHRDRMLSDPAYAARATKALRTCLRIDHPHVPPELREALALKSSQNRQMRV